MSAHAAPAGCQALQAKFPAWKGETLVNAINPHTPGYEAIDPKDPDKDDGLTMIISTIKSASPMRSPIV
jgi:polar amino acid transport system substrate-binding protein